MSDASFEVGYPRRRWTETHLEIGHHDDAPAGVRVPALASPAHRVDGGKAPASQSNSRTTVRDARSYIRGASERGLRLRYRAGPRLWRFRVWKLPTRVRGSTHANTATVDARPRTHGTVPTLCPPGGRDEHRQKKNGSVTKKAVPTNANEKYSHSRVCVGYYRVNRR